MAVEDRFQAIWELQAGQQSDLGLDPKGLDDIERGRVITDLVASLHEETSELGRLGGAYKRHLLTRVSAEPAVIAEEVADVLKCALALAQTFGLSQADVLDAFYRKTDTVRARARLERAQLQGGVLVCCDLDDVICDLAPWREVLENGVDPELPPAERMAAVERLKEQFYEGGRFSEMNVVAGAAEGLRKFREMGIKIVIVTARPQWQYKRLYGDTLEWLQRHGIPFDSVLFNKDKVEAVYQHLVPAWPVYFIEDHERNVKALSSAGIHVLMYDRPHNRDVKESDLITRVRSWGEVVSIVTNGEK